MLYLHWSVWEYRAESSEAIQGRDTLPHTSRHSGHLSMRGGGVTGDGDGGGVGEGAAVDRDAGHTYTYIRYTHTFTNGNNTNAQFLLVNICCNNSIN